MPEATFITSRILPFQKKQVHQAWTNPELLRIWWGPDGFTNEFDTCDIKDGGDWIFNMIAPDRTRYPNISKWIKITPDYIEIEHVNAPHFFMRVDFEDLGENSRIIWTGTFDSVETYEALKSIIIPANEQNLNRLESCLRKL